MSQAIRQIGLFGGSFDPPHMGHVSLVEAGLDVLGLDEVWVIPALPVHRKLSGWHEYPTHLGLCNVAVFARQGVVKESAPVSGWKQVNMQGWRKSEKGSGMEKGSTIGFCMVAGFIPSC